MLKYHSTYIGFREIPDEITLCINITNCCNNCINCHSPWLREDVGTPLTNAELAKLMLDNQGISCVCFMGGDRYSYEVNKLAQNVINFGLKSAWYSGKQELSKSINPSYFNYIKLGPYIEDKGPLDNPNTNQRLYKIDFTNANETGKTELILIDITHKFWKND